MRFPFISHAPVPSGLSSTSVATHEAALPLQSNVKPADAHEWNRSLPDAKRLSSELAAFHHPDHLAKQACVNNSFAPTTPVNHRTLLKQGGKEDDPAARQLHANWTDEGNLVMAVPVYGEAMAWTRACFEHDIAAVVTLGTVEEHDQLFPCMENNCPITVGQREVEFVETEAVGLDGASEGADLISACPEAAVSVISIHTGRADVKKKDARHDVTNYAIPIPPDHAISPRTLLETCRALHKETPARPIAFQSPGGDDRSAVFAVAHTLFQKFAKGTLKAGNLEDLIVQQCIDLRAARSATLFDRPEHLASLLTMGRMMLAEGRAGRLGTSVSMRTPEVVTDKPPGAVPLRSAMKGGHACAGEDRAIPGKLRFEDGTRDNEGASGGHSKRRRDVRDIFRQPEASAPDDEVQLRQSPGRRIRPSVD